MGLEFMKELGIGEDLADSNTEAEANNTEEESDKDLSLEPEEKPSDKDEVAENTELSEMDNLKKQIEGMEKRINDKDDFINELREQAKSKEEVKEEVDTQIEEEDFWDNPEEKYKKLQEQIAENTTKMQVQQLQIQEGYYAQTVDGYFNTVNPESLKEAVSSDEAFAKEFNNSDEPYKVAYEYLSNYKTKEQKLEESIRKKVLDEMNVKTAKEVPPNIGKNGSSNSEKSNAPEDGFASVFGKSS